MVSERRKFGMVLVFAVLFATLAFVTVGCASGTTPPEETWNKTFGCDGYDYARAVQQTADGGYILAGVTQSYGAGSEDAWLVKTDSDGNERWNKTFGGTASDYAYSVQKTADGGYILAGETCSYNSGSNSDFWLIKTDSDGNKQWDKTFGGTDFEWANSVQETADGGYILAGVTQSYGAGYQDFWLVKTDSGGNKQWDKTFGGANNDRAYSVQQTADGGYILAGETRSYGAGYCDVWMIKTDSGGNKQWDKIFGGANWDGARAVQETKDGGYILAGYMQPYSAGGPYDVWMIKTDPDGIMQWNKTFGGANGEEANSVQETADGGYILAGVTQSYGAGSQDFWLIKTDSCGNKQWDKTFGGADNDRAYSVQQTADGGYILAGETKPYCVDYADAWLVKTDSGGNKQWDKTFGCDEYDDYARAVQQTADGGYILAGETRSYGAGSTDAWLVKTDSDGNECRNKTFGGTHSDRAYSVQQTADGGYILAGETCSYDSGSNSDFWLIKTDSDGNKQWDKTFGGTDFEWANSVQETADGGYILAGVTQSYGAGYQDFWLVKTDSGGNKQWDKTFGGANNDRAYSVQQTADGGYILAGETRSYGAGYCDVWMIKTDSGGNKQWDKTFGGANWDGARAVQVTKDGGYILAGYMQPYSAGDPYDVWMIKTDSGGNKQWDKTFGGANGEKANSVQETADGGYILAGYMQPYSAGSTGAWLIKTDSGGNKQWDKTFGGADNNCAYSVQQTADGGYILAGVTKPYCVGHYADAWLIKVKGEEPTISIFDTGQSKNPYPSIMGTHEGIITPNKTIIVHKLYTYSCTGTGGHTEYVKFYGNGLNVTKTWNGYIDDYYNIFFEPPITLQPNTTYSYEIRTGSYPQIIHEQSFPTPNGTINCTQFTDANGKTYTDWIPAIRLE